VRSKNGAAQPNKRLDEIMRKTGERIWGGGSYLDALEEAIRGAYDA
jgi:hypothetical protein